MSPYYRRRKPGNRETGGAALAALGVAAGVAAVTFYFVRLMLCREALSGSDAPALPASPDRALPRAVDSPSGDETDQK